MVCLSRGGCLVDFKKIMSGYVYFFLPKPPRSGYNLISLSSDHYKRQHCGPSSDNSFNFTYIHAWHTLSYPRVILSPEPYFPLTCKSKTLSPSWGSFLQRQNCVYTWTTCSDCHGPPRASILQHIHHRDGGLFKNKNASYLYSWVSPYEGRDARERISWILNCGHPLNKTVLRAAVVLLPVFYSQILELTGLELVPLMMSGLLGVTHCAYLVMHHHVCYQVPSVNYNEPCALSFFSSLENFKVR